MGHKKNIKRKNENPNLKNFYGIHAAVIETYLPIALFSVMWVNKQGWQKEQ